MATTEGKKQMNHGVVALLVAALLIASATASAADGKRDREHEKKAAATHRTMAEAHANAAKCLDAGAAEKACHEQLAKDCKGAGIGKYCGMKHRH
jgi:hypothetical protein